MATKTYCDGCDDEIYGSPHRVNIRIIDGIDIFYDICDRCLDRFDPKTWPRILKVRKT